MGNPLGARKDGKFKAVSTAPSFNKTPMGNCTPPVGYGTYHDLTNSVGTSSNVFFNGNPAYLLDQTTQSKCIGDNPGTAGGVKSGTVNGEIKPTTASKSVFINGKSVVREGDKCTLNSGNCPGLYVTEPEPQYGLDGHPISDQPADSWLGNWWDNNKHELSEAVNHPIEGLKGAAKDFMNIVPQLGEGLMKGSHEQAAQEIEQWGGDSSAAAATRESGDKINLSKFKMSNAAQEGGATISAGVQLAFGAYGLAKGGVALAARGLSKLGIKETGVVGKAVATETAAAGGDGLKVLKKEAADFEGTLKGEKVRLKNVKEKEIRYTKRDPKDTAKLRREFDSTERKKFLKELANDPKQVAKLKKAGLSDADIAEMKRGIPPEGYQVHHKLPLDDGGTNSPDNLVLIKNDPYHKVITNTQRTATRGMEAGETKTVNWPIPEGSVYPQ